jgi:NAD(P)-dependent dehydrogenase (short-subunit alcohol dehydrogenase family)
VANVAILIGAGSTIGKSIISKLSADESVDQVVAISREPSPQTAENGHKLEYVTSDYSEESIRLVCDDLESSESSITQVIICNGILHSEQISPEKRLEDISAASLLEVMSINSVIPMLWLARLAPLLRSDQTCHVAVLSARVGSIADNRSGGWYAYRASKAALNMLVKTTAIELRRRAPNVKIIAFHPGTTDTGLSKPFQRSVPQGKLFTPDFVASALLQLLKSLGTDTEAEFFDWDGQQVPW